MRNNNDGNEGFVSRNEDRNTNYRSAVRTNDGNKGVSGKPQKLPQTNSTADKKDQKTPEFSISRTASEGGSGKVKVSLTYKGAQDKRNRTSDKETIDLLRSASVCTGATPKDTTAKKLPPIPKANKPGDKSSKHDNVVKGADEEKPHKYDKVELSTEAGRSNSIEILEPKYDEVDIEVGKKNSKQNGKGSVKGKSKNKDNDNEHYYHTLEESERVDGGTNEEEYDSPKSKALVVTRVTSGNKKGKDQVLSTEESATVMEARGTRAKSYSEKKSGTKEDKKKKDHEYDQPTHNTLPHRSSANTDGDKKDSQMQSGKLAPMFDDPMYIASTDMSASNASTTPQLVPVKDSSSSAQTTSKETPVLRNPEQVKKGKDDHEYDEPNEKKGKLTKVALYSSRLFDDPKYEEGIHDQ